MTGLFEVDGDDLDPGYINLRAQKSLPEQRIVAALESMWLLYEPYADPDFANQFAYDLDARFWEMFLGYTLLNAGKSLLRTEDRPREGGRPDICVIDGERNIWIEAIAPEVGESDDDRIPEIVPINEGGGLQPQPVRQIHLRITSALYNKKNAFENYRRQGVIGNDDICLIAIGAARFGHHASGLGMPLALSAVFPIGREFVRLDRQTSEVVERGHYASFEIERANRNIPRTAFLDGEFRHVSGLIWSRVTIGNMNRDVRPLSLIHNPFAIQHMPQGWGVWDREFVTEQNGESWTATDILAESEEASYDQI